MAGQRYETNDYYMYVPDNISNDCDVVVYYPGAGGAKNSNYLYGDVDMENYINSNPDKIVVVNKVWDTSPDSVINGLNSVQQNYNTTVGDINIFSASRGDHSVFKAAETFNNNGFHTSNIAILDTSYILRRNDGDSNYGIVIDSDLANNLASNGTSVLIASQYDKKFLDSDNMQELINAGVPITHIHVKAPQDNYQINYTAHRLIKEEFIRNGIMDFLAGDKDSLDSNWSYAFDISTYDYDGNLWLDGLSEEEFNELYQRVSSYDRLDKKYGYLKSLEQYDINAFPASLGYSDDSVTSEIRYVIQKMNDLRKNVSNTQFLGSLGSKLSNLSKSNPVLDYEGSLISSYFNTTGNLLDKVAFLTEAVVNVALMIDNIDANLGNVANDLLDTGSGTDAHNLSSGAISNNPYNLSASLVRNLNNGYKLNVGKYSENVSAGFELRLSNRIYSLNDFDSAYAREKWGYNKEQAREAFIAVCINECDKTPDGMLAVASVALNRCENDHWSSYYTKSDQYGTTDGTKPFDQMFVNNGGQYSVISSGSYKKYMPSLVGIDQINEHLAKYGTSYEELEAIADDALYGGIRNNYYTGFRAALPEYSGAKIDPNNYATNVFRYENYDKDLAAANEERQRLSSMSLMGTSYTGRDSILVSSDNGTYNNISTSPSAQPLISFETRSSGVRTDDSNNSTASVGFSSSRNRNTSVIVPAESSVSVKPSPSVEIPTPKPVEPVVSVENVPSVQEQVISSGETSPSAPYASSNNVSVFKPLESSVSSEKTQSVDVSTSIDSSSEIIAPSDIIDQGLSNDLSTPTIVEPEPTVSSTKPTDVSNTQSSNANNSHLKNIGLAAAGIATLGGVAYTGAQTIKKIKSNQSIDDDIEDVKDGDDE